MNERNKIRQAILSVVAVASLLAAGAAIPKITIHSPGALYFAGQLRMAMGDVQGGLRLVSRAAAERDADANRGGQDADLQATEAPASGATFRSTKASNKATKPVVEVAAVAAGPSPVASPDHLNLLQYEFPHRPWISASEVRALRQESALRQANYQKQVRVALLQVKQQLEQQKVPVPPGVVQELEQPSMPFIGHGSSLP